jgi:hypothetical protein
MPIIPATQEVEIQMITIPGQPRQDPISVNKLRRLVPAIPVIQKEHTGESLSGTISGQKPETLSRKILLKKKKSWECDSSGRVPA